VIHHRVVHQEPELQSLHLAIAGLLAVELMDLSREMSHTVTSFPIAVQEKDGVDLIRSLKFNNNKGHNQDQTG
jgi:hypothetical protein